jgi:predicted unusual protein kinase regulating ubiquinone biosynthesis (AarF/ABC1/UbiB family)
LLSYLKVNLLDSGPILLKLSQWTISKLELQYPDYKKYLDKFKDFYEDCKIHPLAYTISVYKKEYNSELLNDYTLLDNYDIKSGSIAQVYIAECNKTKQKVAIKCIHPYNNSIFIYSIYFFRLTMFIFESLFNYNFFCCEISDLIYWIKQQINLKNEYKNLTIFYDIYKNNKYIIIPKPISYSKSILIMSYEYGESINKINLPIYKKNKLLLLLVAFIKNNLYINRISHCDLHLGNWKIQNHEDYNAICIYDFGLCSINCSNKVYNYLDNWVLKDYNKLTEFNTDNIVSKKSLNKDIIFNDLFTIAKSSNGNFDIYISKLLKYHASHNYIINIEKINIFISLILLQNTFKQYGVLAANTNTTDFYFSDTNCLISLCETLTIMPELKTHLENLFTKVKKLSFYTNSIKKKKSENTNIYTPIKSLNL